MHIISSISSKSLTKNTTFDNCLLIVDTYSKIPKLYGIENIITEEVMDKLDIFQARFVKVDDMDGGIWRGFKLTLAHSLPPRSIENLFLYVEYALH